MSDDCEAPKTELLMRCTLFESELTSGTPKRCAYGEELCDDAERNAGKDESLTARRWPLTMRGSLVEVAFVARVASLIVRRVMPSLFNRWRTGRRISGVAAGSPPPPPPKSAGGGGGRKGGLALSPLLLVRGGGGGGGEGGGGAGGGCCGGCG